MARSKNLLLCMALFSAPAAFAQDENPGVGGAAPATAPQEQPVGEVPAPAVVPAPQPESTLPTPKSDDDPKPPVAPVGAPVEGVVHQAGVGGQTAYGRAGVLELGGSASLTAATDFTQLTFSPSIGWFFQDNLELSGILGVNFSSVGGNRSTFVTALAEPSYHLPFSDSTFGFLGVGAGVGYATGAGLGFAVAPRLGLNLLVGRSGVLTPAAFLNWSTVDVSGGGTRGTTVQLSTTYGLQIGYTVML